MLRLLWPIVLLAAYAALLFGVYHEAGWATTAIALLILLRLELVEVYGVKQRKGLLDVANCGSDLSKVVEAHIQTSKVLHQRVLAIEASLDREAGLN